MEQEKVLVHLNLVQSDKVLQMEQVPVTTGIYSDEYVEILSGLTQGDKVSIAYTASSKSSSSSNSNRRQGPPPM